MTAVGPRWKREVAPEGVTMIEFTKGDMFEAPVDVRVNTVNCEGVMGAGVALAFKNRYPDMFKDYQSACRDGRVRPGTLHVWKSLAGDWVINFPTKRDWRDPSRYEDILSGLDALRNYLREQGPISVALPALGCGHGGLDWGKVSSMIKDSLGDLDVRVLVFEPADSRKAGLAAQDQRTQEHMKALEVLGFRSSELPRWQEGGGLPSTVLAKGDPALLARRWVALLPSKNPTEREMAALKAVAQQMPLLAESVPVALVRATRATERVAELFLNQGVGVVLILPFGPLARKSVARTSTDNQRAPFAMVSVAAPTAAWARAILAQSMGLLRDGATGVLLSDPSLTWLNETAMRTWAQRPVFYLRYDDLSDGVRRMLDHVGARPIGRRSDTGEPNLAPLFGALPPAKRGAEPTLVGGPERFSFPLTAASPSQLRDLAAAIERSPQPNGTVCITVPCGPETEDLRADFRRTLTRDGTDIPGS
jgi:O-acetyl-ADP-ribose deacetylase (regulator of RNase III)